MDDACYDTKVAHLEQRLDRLITEPHDHADARRLCGRLKRHRRELTHFLYEKELDGTNNAAERDCVRQW